MTEKETFQTLYPPSTRVKSEVWEYFGYQKDAKGSLVDDCFPICKICGRKVSAKKGNTSHMFTHLRTHHSQQFSAIMVALSKKKTARLRAKVNTNAVIRTRRRAKKRESDDIDINSQWPQECAPYSPSSETDCNPVTPESPESSHGWMKQEPKYEIIQWENLNTEAPTDSEQDNTLNNAISTATTPVEGLPTSVALSFTNLQCLLESKQERMEALQKQVQDLQEDRTKLQCLLKSKEENMEALEKQVQDLQEDCTKLQCLLESKQEKMETLEKQVQDLQEDHTQFGFQLESKRENIEALEKEKMESLEKQVQDLQEDRRFLRTQIENLTSALSAYLRNCGTRKSEEN